MGGGSRRTAGGDEARNAGGPPATLSRELGEFLLQFSIALHRFGIYPAGHPALAPLTRQVRERLGLLLGSRPQITLGVAQQQLVVEGAATDRRNPVLLDLARRLHAHQIGAISFSRGVDEEALDWVFRTLAVNPDRSGEPEGLRPASERPSLRGVVLHGLGYDLLALEGGIPAGWTPEPARASTLWLGLAQAAMKAVDEGGKSAAPAVEAQPSSEEAGSDEAEVARHDEAAPPADPTPPEGAEVAEHLSRARKSSAYEQVIVGYLLQIAEELRRGSGPEVDGVRRRMAEMVRALDEDALERILRMGGDTARRREFMLNASESMNLDAVLKLLQAAATSSRQTLSGSLTRVLTKLALHAERGGDEVRDHAAGAFRETVEELLSSWDANDASPDTPHAPQGAGEDGGDGAGDGAGGGDDATTSDAYTLLLDTMARAAPVFPAEEDDEEAAAARMEGPDGALRLLQTALEVDGDGPLAHRAVGELVEGGRVMEVLRLVDQVLAEAEPEAGGTALAHRLQRELVSPAQLRKLLGRPEVEEGAVLALARRVGEAALDDLLDALENSDSRTVRRRAFDALSGLGEVLTRGLGPRVPELAGDPRWFVRRNLLALLRSAGEVPAGFSPLPFLSDPDARVRRVALQMAVEHPAWRARALRAGLGDADPAVLRTAVLELQSDFPPELAVPLARRALGPGAPEGLPLLALHALQGLGPPRDRAVRDAVAEAAATHLDGGRSLLGKRRLAASSPESREALQLLLRPGWKEAPAARWIPDALTRTGDPDLLASLVESARSDREDAS